MTKAIGVKVLEGTEVTVTYQGKKESTATPLPGLGGTDEYRYSYQLALTLTPGSYQELYDNQNITLTGEKPPQSEEPAPTKDIIKEENPVAIQSNKALIYSGGTGLILSDEESNGLKIISTPSDQGFEYNSTYFTDIKDIKNKTVPTDSNIAGFIIPYLVNNSSVVHYYTTNYEGGDLTDKIAEVSSLGPIYAINKNTTQEGTYTYSYYDPTKHEDVKTSTVSDGELNLETMGWDPLFCPIYQPPDSEIIEDPADPNSFFKPQHPLNRYVMSRLTGSGGTAPLKDLEVSPLSIRG